MDGNGHIDFTRFGGDSTNGAIRIQSQTLGEHSACQMPEIGRGSAGDFEWSLRRFADGKLQGLWFFNNRRRIDRNFYRTATGASVFGVNRHG